MSDAQEDLLNKAVRSFDAAELLLEGDYADFAASQTYYGCFYVAEALLLSRGLQFSRHGQVVGRYGQEFAKTGEPTMYVKAPITLSSRRWRARIFPVSS